MQLFTATLLKINAYFSRFHCNKNLPKLWVSVVFGQVRVETEKVRGWRGLGWSVGRVWAKFLKLLRVRGGFKFCGCGAGVDTKFQPAKDSTRHISNFPEMSLNLSLPHMMNICKIWMKSVNKWHDCKAFLFGRWRRGGGKLFIFGHV